MKKSFKILTLLALGASTLFFNACSEVEEPLPPAADPICYMTQESITDDFGTETSSFTWDSDDNLVQSVYEGDTTIFEYSGGRLARAYDGYEEATIIYDAGNIPSRINLAYDGIPAGYIILTSDGGNITKVENHEVEGMNDQVTEVSYITYDGNGNVTAFDVDEYNEDTQMFETFLTATNIVSDGKKNPYAESFAFLYLNIDNPAALGKSNITSASISLQGQTFPYTATYTYNDNDYPLTSAITFFIGSSNYTYTYNCK